MAWTAAIEELRNGNHEGADELCAAVSKCARAQLSQSMDAQAVDDYVQEVLIIVLAAIRSGELRNPECLMGFVRTVTRRQVTMHIRSAVVRRRRLVSVESACTPVAPLCESPEARLAAQERIAAVGRVLEELCTRDREILVRFYYQEQDCPEICQEMDLTSTQFRLYKSRALAKCFQLSDSVRHSRRRSSPQSSRQSTRPLRIA